MRLFILCFVISLMTVGIQFLHLHCNGPGYIEQKEFAHHNAVLDGTALSPYKYRIASPVMIEAIRRMTGLDFLHTCLYFRVLQNFLIFILLYHYFRKIGFDNILSITGLGIAIFIFYGIIASSPMAVYSYTQTILFLTALLRPQWIPWLAPLAMLNREEAIFMPVLLYLHDRDLNKAGITFILAIAVYVMLRLILGPAEYAHGGRPDIMPGLSMLLYNIQDETVYYSFARTLGIIPLTVISWKVLPKNIRELAMYFSLPFILVDSIFGRMNETRLFMVPFVVSLIPITLYAISRGKHEDKAKQLN